MRDVRIKVMQTGSNSSFNVVCIQQFEGGGGGSSSSDTIKPTYPHVITSERLLTCM